MPYAYRVRGPYATAIAKMILDRGHILVDLSEQLSKRLGLPQNNDIPPHATVKTKEDDPNTLVIVGLRKAVEVLLNALVAEIPYVGSEYNAYGPYTTLVAKATNVKGSTCIAEYRDTTIIVNNYGGCTRGERVIAHIVKPASLANKVAIAFPGIAILKDTLVLLDDGLGKVLFSEHIRDFDRKTELIAMSSHVTRKGYSIRWRSASKAAPLAKISKDLDEALSEIEKIKANVAGYKLGDVVTEGEAIAFVRLSRPSKEHLDEVRNIVVPTALGHHFMRTCGRYKDVVDLMDMMSRYMDRQTMYKSFKHALADLSLGRSFKLIHRKPTGENVEIGPIEMLRVIDSDLGPMLVGKRIIKSEGVYDGLDVPKERGDIALTLVPLDSWFIVHRYVDVNGVEKGVYVNINTPPEVCPDDGTISYLDLYIDVVYKDGAVMVIDEEELDKAIDNGILGRDFGRATREAVETVKSNLYMVLDVVRNALIIRS